MSRAVYNETVGASIRRQRLALGMSQRELAEAVAASEASISNWELGKGTLSAYSHALLSSYFREQWNIRKAKPPTKPAASSGKREALA